MSRTKIGKVSITPKGEYDETIEYEKLDGVHYEGSFFIAKKSNVGIPPTDLEFWFKASDKGDKPIPGQDYFTEEEITQFKTDVENSATPKIQRDIKNYVDSEMSNYALKDEAGNQINISVNEENYVITFEIKNKDGQIISSKSIDLPLETMVMNGAYNSSTKKIVLTLKNGTNVEFSVAELINGLVNTSVFETELNKKVDKIEGKGLSANDYSNTEKEKVANNTNARHSHNNKNILDNTTASYTTEKEQEIGDNTNSRHTHTNKNILDSVTEAFTTELKNKINSNADKIETNRTNIEKMATNITLLSSNSHSIETSLRNYFAMTQDSNVYTVRFPLWETSHTCIGEKLDANIGKYLNLATDSVREETNYGPAFETIDCNADVDDNGVRHVTALKGMPEFKDTGKVNVFVLGRTYYEKFWIENGYMYYSRTYMPKEGYTVTPMSINKDGTISPYWLIAKYIAGEILDDDNTHKLYSSKGLIPARYIASPHGSEEISDGVSYNGCITLFSRMGRFYSAGTSFEQAHIITTFWLKFATKNSQSVLSGNTSNSFQYKVSYAEEDTNRVVLTTAQANNIDIHSFVSVGDPVSNTNIDRNNGYMHDICNDVEVIGKEVIDDTRTALILDHSNFNTTSTTYVTSMHEKSGYSDYVLGRNGSRVSNTNGKHGAVLDGIEILVGGYEVASNVVLDINTDDYSKEVYTTNDATKLSSNIATIKSTYNKSSNSVPYSSSAGWKYITEEVYDLDNGIMIPTKIGTSGSGESVGFADAVYNDNAITGQREWVAFGYLGGGAHAGVCCLGLHHALSNARWYFLCRPSINLVGVNSES